jgi:hypothetical protein
MKCQIISTKILNIPDKIQDICIVYVGTYMYLWIWIIVVCWRQLLLTHKSQDMCLFPKQVQQNQVGNLKLFMVGYLYHRNQKMERRLLDISLHTLNAHVYIYTNICVRVLIHMCMYVYVCLYTYVFWRFS